jgi:methylthioribose-1-phosphate isomerase
LKAIEWLGDRVRILDQARLPAEEVLLELFHYEQMAEAIKKMRIRGAPAIGIAAAYGIALGAQEVEAATRREFLDQFQKICQAFSSTRPTAVNLFHVVERMERVVRRDGDVPQLKRALVEEARKIHTEEEEADRTLSQLGANLLKDGSRILTHCNAGALATAGYGTALGVIRMAKEEGKDIKVFATETRPLLQGMRLTVWELRNWEIPVTLITDSMAGYFLSRGEIDYVIVGADRIAQNGDVANKIGTYALAVLAMENGIPFYVAAPSSTIDLPLKSGTEIPIEERDPEEITHIGGIRLAPKEIEVANPAFDITPHLYVTAIITEKGIIKKPYEMRLKELFTKKPPNFEKFCDKGCT